MTDQDTRKDEEAAAAVDASGSDGGGNDGQQAAKKGCCARCCPCCKCKACVLWLVAVYNSFGYAFVMTFVVGTGSEIASLYAAIAVLVLDEFDVGVKVFAGLLLAFVAVQEAFAIRYGILEQQYYPYAQRSLVAKLYTMYVRRCYDVVDKEADTHEDSRLQLIVWYTLDVPIVALCTLLAIFSGDNVWLFLIGLFNSAILVLQDLLLCAVESVMIPVRGRKITRRSTSSGGIEASASAEGGMDDDEGGTTRARV